MLKQQQELEKEKQRQQQAEQQQRQQQKELEQQHQQQQKELEQQKQAEEEEKARLKEKIEQKNKELRQKEGHLKDLVSQFVSLKQLLGRNQRPEYEAEADKHERIYLPFVIGLCPFASVSA